MAFKLRNTAEGVSSQLALFILPPTDVGVDVDHVKYSQLIGLCQIFSK